MHVTMSPPQLQCFVSGSKPTHLLPPPKTGQTQQTAANFDTLWRCPWFPQIKYVFGKYVWAVEYQDLGAIEKLYDHDATLIVDYKVWPRNSMTTTPLPH
jgi:hypothetical protein